MWWLVLIAWAAWIMLGEPKKNIANWFWEYEQAPWEEVDAFYYSNRNNLTIEMRRHNVGSVENCRAWVYQQAAAKGDPNLTRGDYECGVGYQRDLGSIKIYRITVN
jgi:hypothetical protein